MGIQDELLFKTANEEALEAMSVPQQPPGGLQQPDQGEGGHVRLPRAKDLGHGQQQCVAKRLLAYIRRNRRVE